MLIELIQKFFVNQKGDSQIAISPNIDCSYLIKKYLKQRSQWRQPSVLVISQSSDSAKTLNRYNQQQTIPSEYITS